MTIRAFDVALTRPWAMLPDALEQLLAIADRMGDPEALAAKAGKPLANTRTVENRDGVAVVPVIGPIFRYANLFTEISGATSTDVLATDIRAAVDDSAVKAIVLNIDSPGGDAKGMHELAQMIFEARAVKPVWAYGGGMVASGGYWIASAAEKMIIDATAVLGSIGVVIAYKDTSKRDAKSDVRTIEIVSSSSPDKRLDPSTDEGRAKVQKIADDMATVFVEAVAQHRNVSPAVVERDFGRGGLLVGQHAVNARMADRLGSLESVISALAGPASQFTRRQFTMSTSTAKGPVAVANTAELHAAILAGHKPEEISVKEPDLSKIRGESFDKGKAEGKTEGLAELDAKVKAAIEGERARIVAIQAIAPAGFETEVAAAIKEGTTAEAASQKILATMKERGVSVGAIASDATRAAHAPTPGTPAAKASGWGKAVTKLKERKAR
jgi:signal peptide peptidase SppA